MCEEFICINCRKEGECLQRQEEEPWIFHEQIEMCMEKGEPCYEEDDYFIIRACTEEGTGVCLQEQEEAE